MNHLITSCPLLCLLLSIVFPGGGCGSQLYVVASIPIQQKSRPGQIPMASLLRTPNSHSTNRKREINNDEDETITFLTNTTDANATNATASPTPSTNPASAPTTPVPTPTHSPTKHYEPSQDDDDNETPKKEGPSVGLIFLCIFLAVSVIWVVCYFRDAILFFFGSAWNNTRRYGCKGCLQSFSPCFFGREYLSGSSEPLDQIIFETEDPTAPLMT